MAKRKHITPTSASEPLFRIAHLFQDQVLEKAFTAAESLDALAVAKTEHLGDRSPIALARRVLGALPKAEKADAGKRVNIARSRVAEAHDARRACCWSNGTPQCWWPRPST